MHLQLPWLTANLQGFGLKLTASSTPVSDQQHHKGMCWQPVLIAYAAGSHKNGQSVREVVRRNPAELLLWATETLGKQIGVVSDPSCHLLLRSASSFVLHVFLLCLHHCKGPVHVTGTLNAPYCP